MADPEYHVVFSPSAAGTLKRALAQAGRPDEVLCPFDNFSFGPIATDDADLRARWVEEALGYTGWQGETDRAAAFLDAVASRVGPATAWMSRRDTCSHAGFLWFLSHVGDAPIAVIEAEYLPGVTVEGMIDLLHGAVPLSEEDRTRHRVRWQQLKGENAPLRVIDGDELVSAPIDYFDETLLRHARPEWRKMARIVGETLVGFHDTGLYQTDDLVLGARLADLAETGRLEWQGDLTEMPHGELRLPTSE
jgi:hypothetical protein